MHLNLFIDACINFVVNLILFPPEKNENRLTFDKERVKRVKFFKDSVDLSPVMYVISLRIIAHEHVRVLMTRGYVDDTLIASSGSGVSLAVWNRGSSCWCLLA